MKNNTPLNDSFKNSWSYKSDTSHKQDSEQNYENLLGDQKFDQLLNEKCSWSYRSQKVIHKGNNMKADAENLEQIQSTITVQMLEKCDKELNDESPYTSNENWLHNVSAQANENTDELAKDVENGRNTFQMKTCSKINRVLSKRPKTENVKNRLAKLRSPYFSKIKKSTKTSNNESCTSSSSSDNKEVLQTRFFLKKANTFKEDDHSNDHSPILSERISDKESIPQTDSGTTPSPIIIQAIPYDKKKIINNSENTEQVHEIKQQEEINNLEATNAEITSEDNYSNLKIGSNYMQVSTENSNEQLDYNIKRKDSLMSISSYEVPLQKLLENITQHDSENTELEDSKVASNDLMVENFLSGSFDVSAYRLGNRPSKENVTETSTFSNIGKFTTNKTIYTKQTNAENSHQKNQFNKRKINELPTANKRTKQNNLYSSQNELFENSPEVLTTGLKRKKSSKRLTKNIQKVAKKRGTKTINRKSERLSAKSEERFSNIIKERSHINNKEDASLNTFISSHSEISNNKTKSSSARKTKTSEEKISNALNYNASPVRHSRRNVRNSSFIASKKIKEIEKLENMSDSYEENKIDPEEEHFTSTPYNLKKYSNVFESRKELTNNRRKVKNQNNMANMINVNTYKFQSKNTTEKKVDSNDIVQFYLKGKNEVGTTKASRGKKKSKENLLRNKSESLCTYDKISLRDKRGRNKNLASDLNFSQEYFTQENEDLCENMQHSLKKVYKEDKSKDFESAEDEMPDNNMNKYISSKNNDAKFMSFLGTTNECKQSTWDALERKLLKDLDEKISLTNNVCKTVILQEEKVVRKKDVVKDTNLITVSNTSMLQTISKSKRGNKYNMQYEIKNTESKFSGKRANNSYNFMDTFDNSQTEHSIPGNSKNLSILDRTVTAMEKCTAKFIAPQVNICQGEQKKSAFHIEDITDNSDANHETQFHSNITFLTNSNEQYYKNEIVSYLRKSKRKGKRSINFKESTLSEIVGNSNDQQRDNEYDNSNDAEHSEKYATETKNYLFKKYPDKNLQHVTCQTLVPYSGEKYINPWQKLMEKLKLEKNEGAYSIDISDKDNTENQNCKSLINDDLNKNSKRKEVHVKDFEEEDINELEVTDTEIEQGVSKHMHNEVTGLLTDHTFESRNLNFEDRLSLNVDTGFKSNSDTKTKANDKKEMRVKSLEKSVKEKDERKIYEKQNVKRSPKYKLKMDKDGGLKFKKNSSRSSSVTHNLEDFTKLKHNATNDLKSNECPNEKTNKAREKYKKYLKKLFDKGDSSLRKDKNDHVTKSREIKEKDISKENLIQDKGSNKRSMKMKLIAENDEDIFSLSSSDSESCNES